MTARGAEAEWRPLCAEVDGDLWFPDKGERTDPAKAVCRGCEVREACLRGALDRREAHGVWGGFAEQEFPAVRRALKAGKSLAGVIADDDAGFYAREDAKLAARRAAGRERRRLQRETRNQGVAA